MNPENEISGQESANTWEMLSGAGYSDKAIRYYLKQPNIGVLANPDQTSEITGQCGDTMRVHLRLDGNRIAEAKFQVLGCPGAVASAMAAADLMKGKTLQQASVINDREIFRTLEGIPDKKLDCIRLAVKTVQKAVNECMQRPLPKQASKESAYATP